ncbi:Ulp1 protease family, C-terminal catalytic domain [Sesbania bispinosa]|nr:Ulp1 protease family, C-terminal catalytic domain [Sesbania bispinosa]
MASVMVRYMPINSTPHASDEHYFESSNDVSQNICGSEKGKETEEIMSRLCYPSEIQLHVGPSKKGGKYKNNKKDGTKKGASIPTWMPVDFVPPESMIIDEMHAKIAAYIFAADNVKYLTGDEVLIKLQWMVGKRSSLKTLMPTKHVHRDVLNMLVCNLTEEEHYIDGSTSTAWFLPTMFAQYALDNETYPDTVMEMYRGIFMGKVEFVRKIFVPISDESVHWYLLVIDIDKSKLILLDSLQIESRRERRKIQVRKVTERPDIAGFTLIEHNGIGHQLPTSNDSGIWVANWMKDYDWDDEYDILNVRTLQRITTASRMRLAIDLVLNEQNEFRADVIKRAEKTWKGFQQHRETIMKAIFGGN